MGAFSGNMSFTQFYIDEPLAEDWKVKYQQAIHHYRLKPLSAESEAERAIGWCNAQYPLETEIDTPDYLYTNYMVLGMRVDTWQVPAAMVKLHTDAEVRHLMKSQNKERINRYEVAEIKERIRLQMKKKTMPTTKAVDVIWHLDDGVVRFFSTSQKAVNEFVDLFEETFQLKLNPHGPYLCATRESFGLSTEAQARLLELEPTPFVDYETMYKAMVEA
ncbi:MAG: recombination-associated protein RdgC [Bradymonadia bacterium]